MEEVRVLKLYEAISGEAVVKPRTLGHVRETKYGPTALAAGGTEDMSGHMPTHQENRREEARTSIDEHGSRTTWSDCVSLNIHAVGEW